MNKNERFLPTPSARRATALVVETAVGGGISTHALREEGDGRGLSPTPAGTYFYPRPPRGGRRSRSTTKSWSNYFYPRPPRGGRPATSLSGMSTTAFLPTPSARRATSGGRHYHPQRTISTHALREEGDYWQRSHTIFGADFYPRPPRGGRLIVQVEQAVDDIDFYPRPPRGGRREMAGCKERLPTFLPTPSARRATKTFTHVDTRSEFLPTPSARRATLSRAQLARQIAISTHALREEGDGRQPRPRGRLRHFYPRPPRGGRQWPAGCGAHSYTISTHALREEGDGRQPRPRGRLRHFYPRPPRGGRLLPFSHQQ